MSDERPQTVDAQIETALAVTPKGQAAIAVDAQGLAFENATEVYRISEAFVRGGVAPKGATPGAVMAAMLKGRALGIDPVTSLANITVVNGRVTIGGALILGLVRKHHACAELTYRWEGEDKTRAAIVRARRVDEREATEHRFGWDDAMRAGLAGKDVYRAYADDMLLWRAVARMGRRQFPDILAGCYVPGEVVEVEAAESPAPPPTVEPPPVDPLLAELGSEGGELLGQASPVPPAAPAVEEGLVEAVAAPAGPAVVEDHEGDPPAAVNPPFPSHSEADRAIAEAEGQGQLFRAPARAAHVDAGPAPRRRRRLEE